MIELESKVEPTWPKLVDPLEKLVDRLSVVWGIVNHLKSVKDSSELRSAIEEVQVKLSYHCILSLSVLSVLHIYCECRLCWTNFSNM